MFELTFVSHSISPTEIRVFPTTCTINDISFSGAPVVSVYLDVSHATLPFRINASVNFQGPFFWAVTYADITVYCFLLLINSFRQYASSHCLKYFFLYIFFIMNFWGRYWTSSQMWRILFWFKSDNSKLLSTNYYFLMLNFIQNQ